MPSIRVRIVKVPFRPSVILDEHDFAAMRKINDTEQRIEKRRLKGQIVMVYRPPPVVAPPEPLNLAPLNQRPVVKPLVWTEAKAVPGLHLPVSTRPVVKGLHEK
jgi:hypothetical protein